MNHRPAGKGGARSRFSGYTPNDAEALKNRAMANCPKHGFMILNRAGINGHRFRARFPPMARSFAYVRMSTAEQTAENQIQELQAAGFAVEPHRVLSETVSGSPALEQRPGSWNSAQRETVCAELATGASVAGLKESWLMIR